MIVRGSGGPSEVTEIPSAVHQASARFGPHSEADGAVGQGVAQGPDVGKTLGGMLGQAAEDDLLEVGGHAGADLARGG